MDILETIRSRRTIRKYTGESVPSEILEQVVDAARMAASGNNRQPWEFIVVTDREILRRLRVSEDHWMTKAGALIAVVMDPESRWWVEDGAAAVQNMLLACTALGIGACWLEGYTVRNDELIRTILGIPSNRRLFTLVSVGIPDEEPVKEKKTLQEVLFWQQYPPNK